MHLMEKERHLKSIATCLKENRLGDAMKICLLILDEDDQAHETWQTLAIIAGRQNRTQEAVNCIQKAIELAPNEARYYNHLGRILRAAGMIPQAAAAYQKALQLDPKQIKAYINLGKLAFEIRTFDDAAQAFRQVLKLDPNHHAARLHLATALQHLGDAEEVVNLCTTLLEQCETPRILIHTSETLFNANQLPQARKALEKARRLTPHDTPEFNILEAKLLNAEGDRSGAIALLEATPTKALPPVQQQTLYGELGRLLDREGNIERAYDCFLEQGRIGRETAQMSGQTNNNVLERARILRNDVTRRWLDGCTPHPDCSDDKTPIFLVGFPRSGTTLMGQILNSHPKLHVVDERIGMETVSVHFEKQPEG